MAAAAANANAISVEMSSNSQQAAPRSVPSESLPNMESIHVAYSKKSTVGIRWVYFYIYLFFFRSFLLFIFSLPGFYSVFQQFCDCVGLFLF